MEGYPVPAARRKTPTSAPATEESDVSTQKSEEDVKADKFMELHALAYKSTSEAMKLDEERKRDQAFNSYQKSLELIDKAVSLAHTGGFPEERVAKVDELVYKMRMTRKEILERVSDIQHTPSTEAYLQGPASPPVALPRQSGSGTTAEGGATRCPPAYDSLPSNHESQTRSAGTNSAYSTLNSNLDEIALEEAALRNPLPLNAHEVFSIKENVQIYFISKDDNVSAPTYPTYLRVVVINQDEPSTRINPPAFLQVGDWIYPLIPGESPIFHGTDGSYIFPDLRAEAIGSSVGLILPTDLPASDKQVLEDILFQLIGKTALHVPEVSEPAVEKEQPAEPIPPQTIGSKIAAGLITGAEKLAHGLVYGAEKTSQYLEKGTSYLVTKIEPAQEKSTIDPSVRTGMKTVRHVTGKAVKVSAYVVNQLSKGTVKLGQHMAPHVHRAATQLYAKTLNTNEAEASGKMDQIIEVTGGAVVGFGTVFAGLEHAATVLAKSLRNNTVTVVQHKYGEDAGSFCEDTTSSFGNAVLTGYTVKGLAPKALAKRVAKDTGKAIVTNPGNKEQDPSLKMSPTSP